ncbi:MAG TPA: alpha/beta hydrolase-fold protein [Candidatus Tumulicola sp.]|jgi:pimeloyl-ACP methyl ester carboxylesterase
MFRLACRVLALLTLTAQSGGSLNAELVRTSAAYYTALPTVVKITGLDTVLDYYQRLEDDRDRLGDPTPAGYSSGAWENTVDRIATLDLALANALLRDSFPDLASIRGLGATFVRSSRDGTMQPVAVYVPPDYTPTRSLPLVVFLHGRPQTETELLAPEFVESLARDNDTIVIAPYGRGNYDFIDSEADVYDALAAAQHAFAVDRRRTYLMGYSMGGFSVFGVAPLHPNDWAAVMCIAGSLLGSRAQRVVAMMSRTPFYVLTGSADESIPTQYPTATAAFLRSVDIPVTFYSEAGGTHRLITLLPILTQAWTDMLHGVVRTPVGLKGSLALPLAAPVNPSKT